MGELARRPPAVPAKKAAAKKAPAKKAPAKKGVAKKVPAKKSPAKKAPVKKGAAKKAHAKKAPAKKAPAKNAGGQGKSRPQADGAPRTASGPAMAAPALLAPPTDPLTILALAEPFSTSQLRRAWRVYAARHHPDQGGDAATFNRGRTAYEALLGRSNSGCAN